MSGPRDKILRAFKSIYGYVDPLLVRSPGRINIIGEHTDYHEGLVLPAAVNRNIVMGICANDSSKIHLNALDKDEIYDFDLDDAPYGKSGLGWPDYIIGVVDQLVRSGYRYDIGGFDAVFCGTIPIGAGIASSAALEGGVVSGLSRLFELHLEPWDKAKVARKAENEFVGVQCGIMDQFANQFGRKGQAMLLDCRSLDFEYVPLLLGGYCLVLCDSGIRRELASTEFNERQKQCQQGLESIQNSNNEVKSLRDVDLDMLEEYRDELEPAVYDCCSYVIEENERVEETVDRLKSGELQEVGELMNATHHGLSEKYKVSCDELDFLAETAQDMEDVLGARMMGGGFGGCTINIMDNNRLEEIADNISKAYNAEFDIPATFYRVQVENGTSIMEIS